MADIAILVAEEYERRLNRERRSSVSAAAASERKVDCARLAAAGTLRSKMVEFVKNKKVIVEPKSQISLAASTGYFSA
ncbi:unnamed protein product [Linum tenue]|uniref:Uncharacterized protein n=1 Tax=Linum tenue TaxID=586396 RepID=A0AAV0RBY9_9ROSI|nr:unnamed protein product [Linum tenue]